jgi:hypothetical protein
VPYAGYGMNAGIADALNLSWLLAARLQGWADEGILDAYEAERQPITQQVSHFAMEHAAKMIKARRAVPPNIEAEDDAGRLARQEIGREAYELNVQQFCCAGLNFGYYYDASPLVVADDEAPPTYTMGDFTPSTVPGCRAPHVGLPDGGSLYDAFGPGYTLLRLDAEVDVAPLVQAAQQRSVPLTVLDLAGLSLPDAYRHKLVLCRQDQHVAWRGDQLPDDPAALVERLRGARASRGARSGACGVPPAARLPGRRAAQRPMRHLPGAVHHAFFICCHDPDPYPTHHRTGGLARCRLRR